MAHMDVIPEWGGYLEYDDYDGRRVTWVAMTNYPRPYWNEWSVYIEEGTNVSGPLAVWWYGEWVVTEESGECNPFDLVVEANFGPSY